MIYEVFLYQIFLISIMITATLLSIWMKFIQQTEHVAVFGELGIVLWTLGHCGLVRAGLCRGGIAEVGSQLCHLLVSCMYLLELVISVPRDIRRKFSYIV